MWFTGEHWRGKRSPPADFGSWSGGGPGPGSAWCGGRGGGDRGAGVWGPGLEALARPPARLGVSCWCWSDLGAPRAGGGSRPSLLAEGELHFEGTHPSAGNKQTNKQNNDDKWKSRSGKSCHFPGGGPRGAGWGRRLGPAAEPSLPPRLLPLDFQPQEWPSAHRPRRPPAPLRPSPWQGGQPGSPAGGAGPLAPPAPTTSPLQPAPLPPARFHSIDFCCMSTLITGECEGNFSPSPGLLMISELVVY